jgi:hypothetical protein
VLALKWRFDVDSQPPLPPSFLPALQSGPCYRHFCRARGVHGADLASMLQHTLSSTICMRGSASIPNVSGAFLKGEGMGEGFPFYAGQSRHERSLIVQAHPSMKCLPSMLALAPGSCRLCSCTLLTLTSTTDPLFQKPTSEATSHHLSSLSGTERSSHGNHDTNIRIYVVFCGRGESDARLPVGLKGGRPGRLSSSRRRK